MIKDEVTSVNVYTKAKGQSTKTQYENFLEASNEDVFFLCHSNKSIDLIGMFIDNQLINYNKPKDDDWKYKKFITISKAKNNKNYNKKFIDSEGKQPWWHPGDNSTFIEVKDILLFEQEILKPLFDISSVDKLNIEVNDIKKRKYMLDKINLLKHQNQIILQGPPGTGKTRLAKQMAIKMIDDSLAVETNEDIKKSLVSIDKNRVKLIQFHPSYSYEDFVRGIVAKSNGTTIEYKTENKILAKMAQTALEDKDKKPYILIIDEINRANLSSVLGELIYALEYRDETVESMYEINGSREIILPSNLYIIGTMNTADRSTGYIDYAIRRRFTFIDILPDETVISSNSKFSEVQKLFKKEDGIKADTLSIEFNPDDVMLGHSYFIADDDKELKNKFKYQVIPLLKEYIKDGVLNDLAKDEIKELEKLAL